VIGVRALAERVAAPAGRILVITDYDGTIAEIDPDPMGARIEPGALRALRRLARLAEAHPERLTVAILTGRAVADVAPRVRVGGLHYVGNHGLETGWLPRHGRVGSLVADGSDHVSDGPAARLGRHVATALGNPDWLFVELKGPSVGFHYRQASNWADAGRRVVLAVEDGLAGSTALERFDGRLNVEFRPAGAGGKRAAMARLVDDLAPSSVLSLGDDRSDAEGFLVLRAARDAGRLAALSVGVHDRVATPAEVIAAADVMLDRPREAARLLSAVATMLEAG
jgi:trehalose-phosphatase